jgi:large subunit ribosomal protein L24
VQKIKKRDEVIVIAGKDKGKSGMVSVVKGNKIVIEKINMVKRNTKPKRNFQGGIVEKSAPMDISNVMVICPACKKPTKISKTKKLEDKIIRSCKKCGEPIDKA